jgi:hypothetical protein
MCSSIGNDESIPGAVKFVKFVQSLLRLSFARGRSAPLQADGTDNGSGGVYPTYICHSAANQLYHHQQPSMPFLGFISTDKGTWL